MKLGPCVGIALVAAMGGCATRPRASDPPPVVSPVASAGATDALATWDDSPPPPDAGSEFAPPGQLTTDEAIAAFEQRVQRNPRDSFALTTLGRLHLRRAKATGNRAEIAEAESLFRRAMQADPTFTGPQ